MKRGIVMFAAMALVVCLTSCGGSSGGETTGTTVTSLKGLATCTTDSDSAVICGTVYAADGETPVVGATITRAVAAGSENLKGLYFEDELGTKGVANDSACQTDSSGAFACSGTSSSGTYTFYITSNIGDSSFSSAVTTGATTDIPASSTTITGGSTTIKWLVVPGAYDGIQVLLAQMKDCTLSNTGGDAEDTRGSTDCEGKNLYVLDDYGTSTLSTAFASLGDIETYNSIFINCATDMSSYATVLQQYVAQGGNVYFSDLADDGLTAAFPSNITFGSASTLEGTITADVDYSGLATYLGSSTVSIVFNLPVWQDISSVASNVTTYISGDESTLGGPADAPITAGWKQGTGGCVFYTSYHVEGASTGSSQEKALKYLVLNISEVCE